MTGQFQSKIGSRNGEGGAHNKEAQQAQARAVATATKPGRHSDGGGLYLKVDEGRKAWIFRYTRSGRVREMGLGAAAIVTLADARARATEYRSLLSRGFDPLDAKKAVSEADRGRKTFGEVANDLMKSKSSEWHNAVHRAQWKQTLETYAKPLWNMPVDEIDTRDVLAVLTPLWPRIPETAARLRGRIEAVLNAAKAHGLRSGENPARGAVILRTCYPSVARLLRSGSRGFARATQCLRRLPNS